MIVVYAVSRNIQTPQNLFDHPCHMYISSSISTTTAKTIYIKRVEMGKNLKERQSKSKLQPTYKPTQKNQKYMYRNSMT